MTNPFAALSPPPVPIIPSVPPLSWEMGGQFTSPNQFHLAGHGTTTYRREISESSDENVFEEGIIGNQEIGNILDQVQHLTKLRDRLEAYNEERSIEEARRRAKVFRNRLLSQGDGGFCHYTDSQILDFAEKAFLEGYPVEHFSMEFAKELRNLSKDIASLLEKCQKILKGITINVEFSSKEYDKLMGAIYAVLDSANQLRIAEYLEKDALVEGEEQVITL